MGNANLTFSFIVPAYNEQDGLETFYSRLDAVAKKLGEPYEIIFVNDGSKDRTQELLARLAAADPNVKVIEFSRNFGHQLAVTAGYDFASGKAVVSLDGDCQHPPELIPELVAAWREGYDIVYTVRKDTAGINPIRRAIGRFVYRVIGFASGAELTDQADFRLMDRKAVNALVAHREQGRFVRGLVNYIGFRQKGIPYVAEKRAAGRSNYSLKQLAGMAGAGVFNFSLKPLRIGAVLGATLLGAAVIYAIISLALWPLGHGPSAMANLFMYVTGLFGLLMALVGLLGEYVGRIFEQVKGRPLYIVRDTIGLGEDATLRQAQELTSAPAVGALKATTSQADASVQTQTQTQTKTPAPAKASGSSMPDALKPVQDKNNKYSIYT